MLKVAIIDDELSGRETLERLLERHCRDVEVIGSADSVEEGLKLLEEINIDLLFLDIEMQDGNGFDLLKKHGEINFEVIFITAYNQYAIKAFKYSAFGYLLKPIKVSELKEEIDRLQTHISKTKQNIDHRVKVLRDSYTNQPSKPQQIVINNVDGFQVVNIKTIVRLEAHSNYTQFILRDGKKITVSRTLGSYEELLSEHGFYRIHQSHMVNLSFVKSFLRQNSRVKMVDDIELDVSRSKRSGFVRRFL